MRDGETYGLTILTSNKPKDWLIWSIEHNAWWKPNERGYTPQRECAGRYTYEVACRIVKAHHRSVSDVPDEAMVPYQPSEE